MARRRKKTVTCTWCSCSIYPSDRVLCQTCNSRRGQKIYYLVLVNALRDFLDLEPLSDHLEKGSDP